MEDLVFGPLPKLTLMAMDEDDEDGEENSVPPPPQMLMLPNINAFGEAPDNEQVKDLIAENLAGHRIAEGESFSFFVVSSFLLLALFYFPTLVKRFPRNKCPFGLVSLLFRAVQCRALHRKELSMFLGYEDI